MSSPVALQAIREMMPDAPVIIMLRDFLSQYPSYHAQMRFIMEEDIADPEQAWDAQADRAAGRRIPKTCLALPRLEYKRVLSVGDPTAARLRPVPEGKSASHLVR